jgi:peptidoglycan/LPS O-acetylase OafA/YrhL
MVAGQKHGFLGVDMFFLLSGFLIVTLLLGEKDGYGDISLGSFSGQ